MEAQLDGIREILPELTINGQVIRFPCKLSEIPGIKTEVRLTGYMIAGDNSCLGFSLNGVHIDAPCIFPATSPEGLTCWTTRW